MSLIYLNLPAPEVGGIFLDGLISESRSQNVSMSGNPIVGGTLITDIAHAENDTIQLSGMMTGSGDSNLAKLALVEEALFNLQNNFGLFTVVTHKNAYLGYMITSLETSIDYPGIVMNLKITAKKIQIVYLTKDNLRSDPTLKSISRSTGYHEIKDSIKSAQAQNRGLANLAQTQQNF